MSAIVPQLRLQFGLVIVVAGLAIANVVQRPSEVCKASPALAVAAAELPPRELRLHSYKLTPADARTFVESVMPDALDFDPITGRQHRQDARGWCKPAAAQDLHNHFYRYENFERMSEFNTQSECYTRALIGEYSLGQLEPDGSVTVKMKGMLVAEWKTPEGSRTSSDGILLHLACNVVLEPEGLRVSRVLVPDDSEREEIKSYYGH